MAKLSPAGIAEGGQFLIDLKDIIGERHDAARFGAVGETKGVPELMNCLLRRSLEQNLIAGRLAIKCGVEAAKRDEGNPAGILRLAEDEVERGHVEVDVGDPEHPVFSCYPVLNPLEDDV